MSVISVRLPDSLHQLARDVSAKDHVSLNQFIASAVAEKVSALNTEAYIAARATKASLERFQEALGNVPSVPAQDFDAL